MQALNERDQFAPPPARRLRAHCLAVLAHGILIGALTWGVQWKTSADQPAVKPSSGPPSQQAAPRGTPATAATARPPRTCACPPPPAPLPRQAQPGRTRPTSPLERQKSEEENRKRLHEQSYEPGTMNAAERLSRRKGTPQKEKKGGARKAEREKAERFEKSPRETAGRAEKKLEQQKAEQENS